MPASRCAGRTKAQRKVDRLEDAYIAIEIKRLAASEKLAVVDAQHRAAAAQLKKVNQACEVAQKKKTKEVRRASGLAAKVIAMAKKDHQATQKAAQKAARSAGRKRRASLNAERGADGAAALATVMHKLGL